MDCTLYVQNVAMNNNQLWFGLVQFKPQLSGLNGLVQVQVFLFGFSSVRFSLNGLKPGFKRFDGFLHFFIFLNIFI